MMVNLEYQIQFTKQMDTAKRLIRCMNFMVISGMVILNDLIQTILTVSLKHHLVNYTKKHKRKNAKFKSWDIIMLRCGNMTG